MGLSRVVGVVEEDSVHNGGICGDAPLLDAENVRDPALNQPGLSPLHVATANVLVALILISLIWVPIFGASRWG